MTQPPSLIADLLDLLDEELRYQFEERAGIIEFDGGQSRDDAEVLALIDLLRTHPGALLGLTVLQVRLDGAIRFVVTTDSEVARQQLIAQGGRCIHLVQAPLVVREQFGGIAMLDRLDALF